MPPDPTAPALATADSRPGGNSRTGVSPAGPAGEASAQTANSRARRLEDLVSRIEAVPDPNARALMSEIVQGLLQLHGEALARILELIAAGGEPARLVYDQLLDDPGLRGLLLIHDLHPMPLARRLDQALAKVLPYIRSHGGNVELLRLQDGIATLRLEGTCKTCSASSVTLELAVRAAIEEFCPDLVSFHVEGAGAVDGRSPYHDCSQPAAQSA